MKFIKRIAVALVATLAIAGSAQAKVLSVGPRVGILANELHFNKNILDSKNRVGFTGGLQLEVMVPVVNLGFDVSVMYARRDAEFMVKNAPAGTEAEAKSDYISIPLNFKWKIGIPVISNILQPYLFTGPDFAFRCSKRAAEEAIYDKKTDVSWNFGLGVQLFNHLQVGASYGIGLTKMIQIVDDDFTGANITARNRYWTVTAAYLF